MIDRGRARAGCESCRSVAAQGSSSAGHGLRHARPLPRARANPLQGSLPDQQRRAHDLDHARRRTSGCPRQGGRSDASNLSRLVIRTTVDNSQLRAGAFAVDFAGDVLAEVGNANFKRAEVRRDRHRLASAGIDLQDLHLWRLGREAHQGGACRRLNAGTVEHIAAEVLRRCTVLDAPISVSLGRGRGHKEDRELSLARRSPSTAEKSPAESLWVSRATLRRCAPERVPGSRM